MNGCLKFDVNKSGDVIVQSDMAAVIYVTSVFIVIEDKLFECVFEEQQQKLFERLNDYLPYVQVCIARWFDPLLLH